MKAYIKNDVVIGIEENDILFRDCEAVEITEEEKAFIEACKLPKRINNNFTDAYVEVVVVPKEVSNMNLRLALIDFDIMPSNIDLGIAQMPEGVVKERIFTLWNFSNTLERDNIDLKNMANQFNITSEHLDQLFIEAAKKQSETFSKQKTEKVLINESLKK